MALRSDSAILQLPLAPTMHLAWAGHHMFRARRLGGYIASNDRSSEQVRLDTLSIFALCTTNTACLYHGLIECICTHLAFSLCPPQPLQHLARPFSSSHPSLSPSVSQHLPQTPPNHPAHHLSPIMPISALKDVTLHQPHNYANNRRDEEAEAQPEDPADARAASGFAVLAGEPGITILQQSQQLEAAREIKGKAGGGLPVLQVDRVFFVQMHGGGEAFPESWVAHVGHCAQLSISPESFVCSVMGAVGFLMRSKSAVVRL